MFSSAAQLLGATWSEPFRFGRQDGEWTFIHGMCAASGNAFVLLDRDGLFVRRTSDAGSSWDKRAGLWSREIDEASIACAGTNVDVVWESDGVVRYARSANGGLTFGRPMVLSPTSDYDEPYFVAVARGAGSLVVVAWDDFDWPDVYVRVRVSKDGGKTFGKMRTLAMGGVPEVAIAGGVTYVAYSSGDGIALRRSTDAGTTWKPPVLLTTDSSGYSSLAARGQDVFVSYSVPVGRHGYRAVYRQSSDSGRTWSTELALAPRYQRRSGSSILSVREGALRVVYEACRDATCNMGVFYREKPSGKAWSVPEMVSTGTGSESPGGLAVGDKVLVGYTVMPPWSEESMTGLNAFVRVGTP